jgi:hypothetical protein
VNRWGMFHPVCLTGTTSYQTTKLGQLRLGPAYWCVSTSVQCIELNRADVGVSATRAPLLQQSHNALIALFHRNVAHATSASATCPATRWRYTDDAVHCMKSCQANHERGNQGHSPQVPSDSMRSLSGSLTPTELATTLARWLSGDLCVCNSIPQMSIWMVNLARATSALPA